MPLCAHDRIPALREKMDKITAANHTQETAVLTSRQQEVLKLLAQGFTMKETGKVLHITDRTVAYHKYRIMANFGLTNNSDLIRFAMRRQVIS